MVSSGGWDIMVHGVVFVTYNQQGGPRGVGKAESVNWVMFMQQHKLWKGTILFRQMFSAESLTSPHPGFPELFQTGETYHGQPLLDHQQLGLGGDVTFYSKPAVLDSAYGTNPVSFQIFLRVRPSSWSVLA